MQLLRNNMLEEAFYTATSIESAKEIICQLFCQALLKFCEAWRSKYRSVRLASRQRWHTIYANKLIVIINLIINLNYTKKNTNFIFKNNAHYYLFILKYSKYYLQLLTLDNSSRRCVSTQKILASCLLRNSNKLISTLIYKKNIYMDIRNIYPYIDYCKPKFYIIKYVKSIEMFFM
jgi:hypothetical protein